MVQTNPDDNPDYYRRKLYALLQLPPALEGLEGWGEAILSQLNCWGEDRAQTLAALGSWWQGGGQLTQAIAAASDRVNLPTRTPSRVSTCHPISGQSQVLGSGSPPCLTLDLSAIQAEENPKIVFWWFWRFYPELWAKTYPDALLYPAHPILPDCPLPSYQSTVSALTGARFPTAADPPPTPYLLLFSFSPVQDFIKASRKFLDFWAGSYLLHYLSARLCWYVADQYGPDAVIVPSLWNQEIFDALMLQNEQFQGFESSFQAIAADGPEHSTPVKRFEDRVSNSLSTAGFPNMITVLVPGKAAAEQLGQQLAGQLTEIWQGISSQVRDHIRKAVIDFLSHDKHQAARQELWQTFVATLPSTTKPDLYERELELLKQQNHWEWGHLWEAQINHTWEPYWAAVPLGNPEQDWLIQPDAEHVEDWAERQNDIAWPPTDLPSPAERALYQTELNVGTWWGSLQQRLRTTHMAVKNTRHWQIPAAPGPRSSLSGQFTAVHPRCNYQNRQVRDRQTQTYVSRDFREGGGLPESSLRLFWLVMAYTYRGLFNGTEMLNALELTKRMAWQFGGVAKFLGITVTQPQPVGLDAEDEELLGVQQTSPDINADINYDQLIRFPNLSSIAAARFVYDSIHNAEAAQSNHQTGPTRYEARVCHYWHALANQVRTTLRPRDQNATDYEAQQRHLAAVRRTFGSRTRGRPFQVAKTDQKINPQGHPGHDYNGVMFSAKWLADDMNLQKARGSSNSPDQVALLRQAIEAAHGQAGFGEGSPGDWWVIVLGDGDDMGQYISGENLQTYRRYVNPGAMATANLDRQKQSAQRQQLADFLKHTPKRMGPATHVGLNRALLDFSNRLVPYLTEQRYCGRVIYSGGDDVMAVLPLEDLPGYLRSLRAAWSGKTDPYKAVDPNTHDDPVECFEEVGGYWQPKLREGQTATVLPQRPLFTMGQAATMSLGIVIANKAVPLPTVLESLWDAEKTAKAMPGKDGLCFRVIYGGGNTLQALMKGHLLDSWSALIDQPTARQGGQDTLSPLLYRLAEELPQRARVTAHHDLFAEAARVIVGNRDDSKQFDTFGEFCDGLTEWLRRWEDWVRVADPKQLEPGYTPRTDPPLSGTSPEELGYLLRFSAFWASQYARRCAWGQPVEVSP